MASDFMFPSKISIVKSEIAFARARNALERVRIRAYFEIAKKLASFIPGMTDSEFMLEFLRAEKHALSVTLDQIQPVSKLITTIVSERERIDLGIDEYGKKTIHPVMKPAEYKGYASPSDAAPSRLF